MHLVDPRRVPRLEQRPHMLEINLCSAHQLIDASAAGAASYRPGRPRSTGVTPRRPTRASIASRDHRLSTMPCGSRGCLASATAVKIGSSITMGARTSSISSRRASGCFLPVAEDDGGHHRLRPAAALDGNRTTALEDEELRAGRADWTAAFRAQRTRLALLTRESQSLKVAVSPKGRQPSYRPSCDRSK